MPDETDFARLEQILEETKEIAEENNQILRELRRNWRVSFWIKVVLWALVLILPFLLIGPVLNAIVPAVSGEQNGVGVFGVPDTAELQQLIDTYRQGTEG